MVPGCGRGYDLATLAHADREVIGIDLSEEARESFYQAHDDLPGTVRYEVADFFRYGHDDDGFDFVWDYTFFCALDPADRGEWADAMKRLVKPQCMLATLLFPYEDPVSGREGPPWPINTELVRGVLDGAFIEVEVSRVEESHAGREGREHLALWRRVP